MQNRRVLDLFGCVQWEHVIVLLYDVFHHVHVGQGNRICEKLYKLRATSTFDGFPPTTTIDSATTFGYHGAEWIFGRDSEDTASDAVPVRVRARGDAASYAQDSQSVLCRFHEGSGSEAVSGAHL